MEPEVVRLIADLAVDFSKGQDGGARARWHGQGARLVIVCECL